MISINNGYLPKETNAIMTFDNYNLVNKSHSLTQYEYDAILSVNSYQYKCPIDFVDTPFPRVISKIYDTNAPMTVIDSYDYLYLLQYYNIVTVRSWGSNMVSSTLYKFEPCNIIDDADVITLNGGANSSSVSGGRKYTFIIPIIGKQINESTSEVYYSNMLGYVEYEKIFDGWISDDEVDSYVLDFYKQAPKPQFALCYSLYGNSLSVEYNNNLPYITGVKISAKYTDNEGALHYISQPRFNSSVPSLKVKLNETEIEGIPNNLYNVTMSTIVK